MAMGSTDSELERLTAALADRYRVEGEISRGGMATVYRAHDLKHDRPVAIKVLDPELARSVGAQRFLREIRTIANLTHPHILALFDSGQSDGFLYFVMPYLKGESLRDRISREKQLPVEEAVRITREVAEALAHAHAEGVIHRDVKPANIMLEAGHALLADFGVAHAVGEARGERMTRTGASLGTPDYMSPEQATDAAELDGRTDQYGLACVLYEMLGGQPPFTGPTGDSVVRQHMTTPPTPITVIRPSVPRGVAAALERALSKTPADRFKTLTEFAAALAEGEDRARVGLEPRRPRTLTLLLATAVVALLAMIVWWRFGPPLGGSGIRSVVVLPPEITGEPTTDGFLAVIHRNLIKNLNRYTDLSARSPETSSRFHQVEMTLAEFIGFTGVDAAVSWSARQSPDSVHLELDLYAGADREELLWYSTFSAPLEDQQRLIYDAAVEIGGVTGRTLRTQPIVSPTDTQTVNPLALRAYQRGIADLEPVTIAGTNRAIAAFSRAVELDPSFAPSYAGLATTYMLQCMNYHRPQVEVEDSVRLMAERALELDTLSAEAHEVLGSWRFRLGWDMDGAEDSFLRAIGLNKELGRTHFWYSQLLAFTGRGMEAVPLAREAERIDPQSMWSKVALAYALASVGSETEAVQAAQELLELYPESPMAPHILINAYSILGMWDEAVEVYRRVPADFEARPPEMNNGGVLGWEGLLRGLAGQRAEAERILDELLARQGQGRQVNSDAIAWVYVGLGQLDEAVEWFEQAFEERENGLVLLNLRPFEALRGNPRFEEIRRGVFGEYVVG